MATANLLNDVDDFVTCGVCLCEYDSLERKPKFLQCAHTVCLHCLTEIFSNGRIICPFCRNQFEVENVIILPNNSYALHMLKSKDEKREVQTVLVTNPLVVNWCLTCGAAEKAQCSPSGHLSVNMTADTIKNMESFLNLKQELLQLRDKETNNLKMAIKKRQKVKSQLAFTLKSIQAAFDQVKKLEDENNLLLAQLLTCHFESKSQTSKSQDNKTDIFLQELIGFVKNSSPHDTPEVLRTKMSKSVEISEQKLCKATALASEYQLYKKAKFVVQMFNEKGQPIPTCGFLDKGFCLESIDPCLKSDEIRQDLTLIAHGIISLLKRGNGDSGKNDGQTTNFLLKSLSMSSSLSNNSFVQSQSIFIMRLFKLGVQIGEIHFCPTPTFTNKEFMQKLGDFCYKSPKDFGNAIQKPVPGAYVLFKMVHKQFQANFPNKFVNVSETADKISDVGIVLKTTTQPGGSNKNVVGWNFIFPLEGLKNPKINPSALSMESAMLFGRVIHKQMLELIATLSSITNKADRSSYSMSLESR